MLKKINSRHHAAIYEDASLKLYQFRMLAIVQGILADLRCAPAVDGDVEVSTRIHGRDEASHRWHAECAPILDELVVRNDMAVDLEFLQRDTSITA